MRDVEAVHTLPEQPPSKRREPPHAPEHPTPTPFPPLPFELVLNIVEIAARESTHAALALALVSRTVRTCITPIIYHTVVLRSRRDVQSFYTTTTLAGRQRVRNISLFHCPYNRAMGIDILRCTHATRLVLGLWAPWNEIPDVAYHKAREVVLINHAFAWTATKGMSLRNVTHFYFAGYVHQEPTPDLEEALPLLTHFGYLCPPLTGEHGVGARIFSITTRLLAAPNPRLEVVLLVTLFAFQSPTKFVGQPWVALANIRDSRLVARPGLSPEHLNVFLESGETIWDRAKERFGDWRTAVRE